MATALGAVLFCVGCGGNVGTSSGSDASMGGSGQTQGDSGSSACSATNPCPAGDAGCAVGCSHAIPAAEDAAQDVAAEGARDAASREAAAQGATAQDAGVQDGDSDDPDCSSGVAIGCSCPTTYDGGMCVCTCFSMPECPTEFQSYAPATCADAGSCMNCLGGTSGVIFSCVANPPDGGTTWVGIPTEEGCTGGTFHG
jgi:hypothetical protein